MKKRPNAHTSHKGLAKDFQLFRCKASSVFMYFPSSMCACVITVAKFVSAGRGSGNVRGREAGADAIRLKGASLLDS